MIKFVIVAAMLGTAGPALAQGFTDLAAIDRAVADFTGAPRGNPGGALQPVDPRLRLVPCRTALALDWYGSQRSSVSVRCPVPGGWRLYVAVASSTTAAHGAVAEPLVQRGDAVTIMVSGEGFAVSQPGAALEAGAAGVWIKVHGTAPGAPVLRARVIRPGVVGMDLP